MCVINLSLSNGPLSLSIDFLRLLAEYLNLLFKYLEITDWCERQLQRSDQQCDLDARLTSQSILEEARSADVVETHRAFPHLATASQPDDAVTVSRLASMVTESSVQSACRSPSLPSAKEFRRSLRLLLADLDLGKQCKRFCVCVSVSVCRSCCRSSRMVS